ncbi:hypothetical protein GALL_512170 [mine drainage metagenome]|uniref:Uncharacterized protein n=1 Tax=mine drainage metagenome TaxID=410659 RepID=A0A1J5P8X9_9ZZZZ
MTQLPAVAVDARANVYFGGLCVSHTVHAADGSRKSVGVILPTGGKPLTFNTGAPERMDLVEGQCRVRLPGTTDWQTFRGGESFSVGGNTSFDIDVSEALHYVCHFG